MLRSGLIDMVAYDIECLFVLSYGGMISGWLECLAQRVKKRKYERGKGRKAN